MFQVDVYKTYIARVYVIFCEFGGELRGSYIQNLFRIGRALRPAGEMNCQANATSGRGPFLYESASAS